jgi:hypothetical protein
MALPQPSTSFQYFHVNANGSTNAALGRACQLHSVTINSKGATGNTLTIYDSLTAGSGTVVAVIDTTSQIQTVVLDAWLRTGLSYTLATGTAGDLTILAS